MPTSKAQQQQQQQTERANALAAMSGDCAAILPYWPVWAAAQFASDDAAKQILQFVHVWRDGDAYQIESTDGHRAFRYRLPLHEGSLPTLWRIPDAGLLLNAKPLKKPVPYAALLTVTQDLRAVFHGGKAGALAELSSVNLAGAYGVHTADDAARVSSFPSINQLWPDAHKRANAPGAPWCFNARYVREFCSVVEKLSPNGIIRFESCASPTTPFLLSCNYDPRLGQHFEDPQLQLLLMPVQVRR